MKKAFEDDNDEALKAYLATSSDEEVDKVPKIIEENSELSDEDDEAMIAKYRALLNDASVNDLSDNKLEDENNDETGMEMTFVPESDQKMAEKERAMEKLTPWEKYLQKKKDKRKEKRDKKTNIVSNIGE